MQFGRVVPGLEVVGEGDPLGADGGEFFAALADELVFIRWRGQVFCRVVSGHGGLLRGNSNFRRP